MNLVTALPQALPIQDSLQVVDKSQSIDRLGVSQLSLELPWLLPQLLLLPCLLLAFALLLQTC